MPQGRRKMPFSGKAKKVQLQQKRGRGLSPPTSTNVSPANDGAEVVAAAKNDVSDVLANISAVTADLAQKHRFDLLLRQESKSELAAARERARLPIHTLHDNPETLRLSLHQFFPHGIDFPKRPVWDEGMSKGEVESSELNYFRKYVLQLLQSSHHERLGYFELNLETWRQFWRVIEMSDILLFVVDIRCPVFPVSLPADLKDKWPDKHLILVLNKVDLVPAGLALAWKEYFECQFPSIRVTYFSSCPSYNLATGLTTKSGLKFRLMRGRISMVTAGAELILQECQEVVATSARLTGIDLEPWKLKIRGQGQSQPHTAAQETSVLTLGTLGHPNVGKSSLINSLMGDKVVSVSKTPGHTKHFQTMYLCKTVKLCDCPGLVFPSLMPKELQVLFGCYPIAQLRQPFSAVQYLAERVDLPRLLNLQLGDDDLTDESGAYSAFDLCCKWAEKRGYTTARSARPDTYRAANHILRMALESKISLIYQPEGYDDVKWQNHDDIRQVRHLLGLDHAEDHEDQELDDALPQDQDEDSSCTDEDEESPPVRNKFSLLRDDPDE